MKAKKLIRIGDTAVLATEESIVVVERIHEGQPINPNDDVCYLDADEETGEIEMTRFESTVSRKGPSRANSRAFRNNFDAIFGAKPSTGVN